MKKCDTDNISKLCNRLADKHGLNVTVVRDLVEDLRRWTFQADKRRHGGVRGADIYETIRTGALCQVSSLPRRPRTKRGAK